MTKNYLKFWGTRGSCPVSGPEYAKFGGNTASLELCYGDQVFLFDAGSGIRPLGGELVRRRVRKIHLFMSHAHWDHLLGFPFFDPIYEPGTEITIWSPPSPRRGYKELFQDLLAPEFFPIRMEEIQATLEFKTIQQKTPIVFGDVVLDFHTTYHPGLTYCFKIQTPEKIVGYVTDNEVFPGNFKDQIDPEMLETHQSLLEFLTGCDYVVHEAQYTTDEYRRKAGWGHSSAHNSALFIEKTKTPHWLIVHHDPKHTDSDILKIEEDLQKFFHERKAHCKVKAIGDGFKLEIN